MNEVVEFGFLEDFEWGNDTILFTGSREALLGFASLLAELSSGSRAEVVLDSHSLFLPQRDTHVRVLVNRDVGPKRIQKPDGHWFDWHMSSEAAGRFAQTIDALHWASPGYNFLDSEQEGDCQVVVSHDEYPPGWMARAR